MPENNNNALSPCLVVIFGASGDLTERKLIPALYDLHVQGQLPDRFAVMGISRTKMSDDAFRDHIADSVKQHASSFDDSDWRAFATCIHYHPADGTDISAFDGIKQRMSELADEHGTGENVLFYLSVAPHLYDPVIANIGEARMVTEGKAWCSINRHTRPWQRIVVEKPFGRDLESAAHLNRVLGRVFEEESIYRIDHYLGKETVQNLLVFRFANSIFEPIWNSNYIDHVQLTAAETVGLEGRGGYYDSPSGGAMRDMIQSHLLQVMALVAMEPPVSMQADDIRVEKTQALRAARPVERRQIPRMAVRGQYAAGQVDSRDAPGFLEEEGVDENSRTETFAAMQVFIDSWRWGGVPFYLRSGKRLARKTTEIVINFKQTPHCLFRDYAQGQCQPPNQIIINVQPDEGIRLRFEGKVPGTKMQIKSVVMDFDYVQQFEAEPPEAYSTLLMDVIRGDQTLFKHRDEIEQAWRVVQPIIDSWASDDQSDIPQYASGSWGPRESDDMMAREGRQWHNP